MAELKRYLGIWGAASIRMGAIIGAGIFVLSGVASGFAGYFVYFAGISPTAQSVTIIVAVACPLSSHS
jgi:hypothetical protein